MPKIENRSWASVQTGDELPAVSFGPVTISQLVRDAYGTRDLYPIHHDREFARANGHRDSFLNTMWYHGFFGRLLTTEWAGHEAVVRALSFRMLKPGCLGDTLTGHGTVTRLYEEEGRKLADVDLRIDNSTSGPTSTVGRATVEFAE